MQLEYSEANKAGKLNIIAELIAAVILGASVLAVIVSVLGLSWNPGDLSGSPADGLVRVWNTFADKLGSTNYVIIDKFGGAEYAGSSGTGYGLFLLILGLALILISYFIIKSRFRPLLLVFAVPLVVLMLGLGISPGVIPAVAYGAANVLALSVMNTKGRISPAFFLVPLVSVALAVGVASALDYAFQMDRPSFIAGPAEKVSQAIDGMRYGSDALPNGDIGALSGDELKENRGDIDEVKAALSGASASSGKTALRVTMSEPVSTYLRGYVGANYGEGKWSELTSQDFYKKRDDLYWLNRQGFDGLVQIAESAHLGGYEDRDIVFDVEVDDARKRVAYTPYELTVPGVAEEGEISFPKGYNNYGGSFLGNKGVFGKNKYTYSMAGDITGEWTDAVGKLYTAEQSDAVKQYFVNESNYNVSVYEDYLEIPDAIVAAIAKEIGSPGDISNNHADYKETIETVKQYLSDKYIYSENFDAADKGADVMTTFMEKKLGSDVHFASLAALMFRYFGIPARYVEGYLVSPGNVEGAADGDTITVTKAANHAWPEIYIDGFGWVPIEVTPEYSGIMKEADMEKGLDNVDYDSRQQEREQDKEKEDEEELEEEKSNILNTFMRIMMILLIVLMGLILLALLVLIGIQIAKFIKWRLAFRDKDPKKGVRAIYQFGNEKKYLFSPAADEIGMRASYSTRDVTEEDRTKMKGELKTAREKAKAAKSEAKANKAAKEAQVEKKVEGQTDNNKKVKEENTDQETSDDNKVNDNE